MWCLLQLQSNPPCVCGLRGLHHPCKKSILRYSHIGGIYTAAESANSAPAACPVRLLSHVHLMWPCRCAACAQGPPNNTDLVGEPGSRPSAECPNIWYLVHPRTAQYGSLAVPGTLRSGACTIKCAACSLTYLCWVAAVSEGSVLESFFGRDSHDYKCRFGWHFCCFVVRYCIWLSFDNITLSTLLCEQLPLLHSVLTWVRPNNFI